MLEANAKALLGDLSTLPGIEGLGAAPEVALDARVRPHEWLRTDGGFLKTDALDHHRDHFYPGPADIAWDVAGLIAEFDLPAGEVGELAAAALGDPGLPRRLPFHRAAYLAARAGEAAFAAQSLGGGLDGRRAQRALARYRRLLRECLRRP